MQIKKFIPNVITLLNLFCGSIAVLFAVNNLFVTSALFVFLGIFFDFFDGLLARKLNVQSELGLQLDSLADMVTSGLIPGIVLYKLIAIAVDAPPMAASNEWSLHWSGFSMSFVPIIGLFVTLASAYRLATFNLDEDQQTYFKGLPTPANTLLIMSLPLIMEFQNNDTMNAIILNKWFLIVVTFVSCYLLNAKIKLLALKFKNWSFKDNAARYMLIILAAVLLIVFQFAAIPLVIIAYITISLLNK
jgi:CDP-diacylglycerol--serine O-phosphatidyltransferase